MKRVLFWGLVGLTLVVYASMLTCSLPTVSAAAGGLAPFDMRPGGYTFADAQAFLAALSTAGADFYRNEQQRLDIFYPFLIALTLCLSIASLLPRNFGRWRWMSVVVAAPIAILDYLENHAVAVMLDTGAALLTPAMVEDASRWTVLKSGATTVAMVILLCLLTFRLMRWLWSTVVRRYVASPVP